MQTAMTLAAIEYLTLNMRKADSIEIFGTRSHDDPLILAREVAYAASLGKAAVFTYNNRPSAILGVTQIWNGVWSAFCFGTDDWARNALELTRYGLKVLKPLVIERGGHRIQCESHIDHTDSHRWLEAIGATREGTLRGYGRDGSDYYSYGWKKG